jgi:hypothetical protein
MDVAKLLDSGGDPFERVIRDCALDACVCGLEPPRSDPAA